VHITRIGCAAASILATCASKRIIFHLSECARTRATQHTARFGQPHQNRLLKRSPQAGRGLQISIAAVIGIDQTYGKITLSRWQRLNPVPVRCDNSFAKIGITAVPFRLSNKFK
jgi:hypothetical protein